MAWLPLRIKPYTWMARVATGFCVPSASDAPELAWVWPFADCSKAVIGFLLSDFTTQVLTQLAFISLPLACLNRVIS
jgi:hypothetical protein